MSSDVSERDQDALLGAVLSAGGDPADLPFWQGCEEGRLLVHQCRICGRNFWPASRCVEHGDEAMEWVEASGKASLHTWTIIHRSFLPAMKDRIPFVVAVVKLAEGPFYHSNIIDCDHDALHIDMPLMVTMQSHESGLTLPMFVPCDGA